MHILIIPSWYPNKPGQISGSFFREQTLALHRRGCKVGVIYPQLKSLKQWRSLLKESHGYEADLDQGVPTILSHSMQWFPRFPVAGSRLWVSRGLKLYKRYVDAHGKPDVIHAHSLLYAGCLARKIMTREGIPYLVTEHSSAYARGRVSCLMRSSAKSAAGPARRRLAVSPQFAEFLNEYFAERASPWESFPNMVHHSFEGRHIAKKEERGEFTFICVASLTENKCVDNILKAFADSFLGHGQTKLKIGGDGSERERLEALAKALGIMTQVQFLGTLSREQVVEEMASSDVLVLASRYETFGVVAIEAMALGKPVIATRCGGPESVVNERDGILVPLDDVSALAKAMSYARANIKQYNANRIRRSCLARFGERAVTEKLMQIYADTLSDWKSSGLHERNNDKNC